jgi:hypothetical protein
MDRSAKTFSITIKGEDYNGQAVEATVEVCTHGDAAQAEYVVRKDFWPAYIRKGDLTTVRVK